MREQKLLIWDNLCRFQWRIQDFPQGGCANSQNCSYFSNFCWKLHENERIWTPGGRASLAPPLDPPMDLNLFIWMLKLCWEKVKVAPRPLAQFPKPSPGGRFKCDSERQRQKIDSARQGRANRIHMSYGIVILGVSHQMSTQKRYLQIS